MTLAPTNLHFPDSAWPETPGEPPAPERLVPALESAPTYIGPGIKIKGTITADENLYVDGDIEGSLSAPGHCLTVGETAYIEAETIAREAVIYGAIRGGLWAFDRIEIKKHGSAAGDLATAKIVIEDGACFNGVISADAPAGAQRSGKS